MVRGKDPLGGITASTTLRSPVLRWGDPKIRISQTRQRLVTAVGPYETSGRL